MFTDTLTLIVKIYTKCDLKTIQLKLPHKHFILYSGERVLRGNHNFAYQIDLLNITNSGKKKKISASPAGNYVKHETLKLSSLATTSKDMIVR